MSFDFNSIVNIVTNTIVSAGTIFASIYALSKKFRNFINSKLKDTDVVVDLQCQCTNLETKQTDLETQQENLEKEFGERTSELKDLYGKVDKLVTTIEGQTTKIERQINLMEKQVEKDEEIINKIDDKLEKDKESTILTLKYEIQDICSRARRYNSITNTDKSLLCELYHEYVEVWHENHYIKSEAKKVIDTFEVVDEYRR